MRRDQDHYEVLQVAPDATQEIIEAAYRRLAQKYEADADKDPQAAIMMRALNEAHHVLTNPIARAEFDRLRAARQRGPGPRLALPTVPRSARRYLWAGLAAIAVLGAFVALLVAGVFSGGGKSFGDVQVPPGGISCDAFALADSYRWNAEVLFDLKPRDPSLPDTDGYGAGGFTATQDLQGAAQGPDKMQVTMTSKELNPEGSSVLRIGNTLWFQTSTGAWDSRPANEASFSIPYVPADTCNAVQPDIHLDGLTGAPELVGQIASHKYHFDSLTSDLPDRHPSFGPGSDAARFVNVYAGDIWVADDGGYISKIDLSGIGRYDNGRELVIRVFYELLGVNDGSVDIKPPV